MQTLRKTESKAKNEKSSKTKDTPSTTKKSQDDKLKNNIFTVSTPRNYTQKTTTADIYGQIKGSVQSVKAPRKLPGASNKTSNVSPMKDLLKSSSSSVSQISRKSVDTNVRRPSQKKLEAKAPSHTAKKETPRKLPFVNVTVNSPIVKRKLNLEHENVKEVATVANEKKVESKKVEVERQRSKTRTLHEDEVKVLTPDAVDNNAEMMNLSRKLIAKPKAFYIDLDGEQSSSKVQKDKSSDEDVSYEDDFESYESDFESYHSESKSSDQSEVDHEEVDIRDGDKETEAEESHSKEVRDEERMLDSGSFDLRDQRSANKVKPAVLDFILEGAEGSDDKKISLTDEGFQEMSSSSAVSSMRTVHVEVLDRPLFIDFTKSKENKRKRKINENLKQRAKDLLAMITLHEMSYSLFEMKPISYDLYMATFGRSNYTQTAVQTFDDGVTQEVQTDELVFKHKWTQNPVEFSNSDIYLNNDDLTKKSKQDNEDYLTKFTFLIKQNNDDEINNKINTDLNYKSNPLRVYLEQKKGVGSCEMLPYGNYKSKINNNEYNPNRLRKFLKKMEGRISSVLSSNTGNSETNDLDKSSKYPFSKGYVTLSTNNASDFQSVLKYSKITQIYFSETKSNLLMTVHLKVQKISERKCVICLWDISITRCDPIKILVAIDDVIIARFRGNNDGLFVAALEDRSIHLWDLSEEATWRGVSTDTNSTELVNIPSEQHTQMEKDREWNLKNSNVGCDKSQIECALQACAFTSSASNVCNSNATDCIVGLELSGEAISTRQEGRRILGQVITLQRIGIITIWLIIQEKSKTSPHDIGKAFWSKLKLEKNQTISLLLHYDVTTKDVMECNNFNLNAAKRRLSKRKLEKSLIKEITRPKTALSKFKFDSDRPVSASKRKMLQAEKSILNNWENGLFCNDMKVMRLNNEDNYLVAKNCGEVLCCRRSLGAVKVNKLCVASDTSSVTCVEISPHGLPYFLAATDSGTVNLCSLNENRVLLTLDCRNGPQSKETTERCNADHKGRYISSVSVRSPNHSLSGVQMTMRISVTALVWSRVHPCYIFTILREGTVVAWDLTCSDIYAKCVSDKAAVACAAANSMLALLTPEGEVQLHRLTHEQRTKENLELFEKYVALL